MFPLSIVHSLIQTLLLALAASGRSAYPHGMYPYGMYPHEYLFADPKMSIAFALPYVQNTGVHEEQCTDFSSIRIVLVSLVEENTGTILVANAASRSAWTLEVSRRNAFLGAPSANTVLLPDHVGKSIAKIRKIFTVRKNNIAHDDSILSYSAPPDDYDSLPDVK
jgi:hypothetical protein